MQLKPGANCWRIEPADRFALLVDGDAYFTALREALQRAQQTIFIVGWDIDSRLRLMPGGAPDGLPEALGDFLEALVAARRQLRVYVLAWDFAMLYAFEREWLPVFKTGWRSRRRMIFRQDGTHPVGASHHQKIVVIDDALAFVGGLDLTRSRWDTSAHTAHAPLRRDADGTPYPPFHDVHSAFDGAAAHAVGELVRERWRRATGRPVAIRTSRRVTPPAALWPASCPPDVEHVELALARTEPPYAGRAPVTEIRDLYLDAIAAARRALYFENQYFTSSVIGSALAARLREPDGPDIVVVSRREQGGWLQEATMGVLRGRLDRMLREADTQQRYKLFFPVGPDTDWHGIAVHSKLMIVDDDLLFVGSANLNNRSMVLDTECNVALHAAGDPRLRRAIAGMRNRLLGEHLGAAPDAVDEALHAGSLLGAVTALSRAGRTLQPVEPAVEPSLDALVPAAVLFDPEQPAAPEELVRQLLPAERSRPLALRLAGLGGLALLAAVLLVLWKWTPLGEMLSIVGLEHLAQRIERLPFSPVLIVLAYVVAAVLSVPITLLIGATGLVFGAGGGLVYALAGTMISAMVTYWLGRWLGRDAVRRFAGRRINRLSEKVAQRGLVAVVILRVMPIAPFTIVNLVAGASQIMQRDFLLGTLIGMTPGIVLTVAFAHQLVSAIRHPTPMSVAVVLGVGLALVALSVLLQRLFREPKSE